MPLAIFIPPQLNQAQINNRRYCPAFIPRRNSFAGKKIVRNPPCIGVLELVDVLSVNKSI
jgi:hypothetical protein